MASRWQEHSLGIGPQIGGFGTYTGVDDGVANTDGAWAWIQGDKPKIQLATELTELDLMTGQIGAAPERLIGRRHATIGFSMPLEGFKTNYNPAAEDPGGLPVAGQEVVPPWFCLLANALGSKITSVTTIAEFWRGIGASVSQYTAAGMEAGTPLSIVTTDAAGTKIDGGQLIVASLGATSTTPQFGFVKTKVRAPGAPFNNTFTLFEPAGNDVANTLADTFGTANAWLSSAIYSQIPVTIRHTGEGVEACQIFPDCVCTGAKITWDSGAVPTIEFTFNAYDFRWNKTRGLLSIPAPYQRIPQIVGANNGRVTLGRVKGGTFSVAAADAVQCGLESCVWEYKVEIAEIKCHSATQGISGVVYKNPRITASASLAWSSTDEVRNSAGFAGDVGSHWWQSHLELAQRLSLGVYIGSNVGRLFAFLIPHGILTAVPQVSDIGGADGYQLSIEAASYSEDSSDTPGDTAETCPLGSIARLALG